jgi:hypothetical protein
MKIKEPFGLPDKVFGKRILLNIKILEKKCTKKLLKIKL